MAQNKYNQFAPNMKICSFFIIAALLLFFLYIHIQHNENSTLNKEIARLHDKDQLVIDNDKLNKDNKELNERLKAIESSSDKEKNELGEKLKKLEASNAELVKKEQGYRKEIEALNEKSKKMTAKSTQAETLIQKYTSLENKYKAKNQELYKITAERNQLISDNSSLRQNNSSLASRLNKFESAVRAQQEIDNSIVHIGDSKETVKSILGNPDSILEYGYDEWWVYGSDYLRHISFSKQGKVNGSSEIKIDPSPR